MMSGSNQCQHKGKNSEYSHFFKEYHDDITFYPPH